MLHKLWLDIKLPKDDPFCPYPYPLTPSSKGLGSLSQAQPPSKDATQAVIGHQTAYRGPRPFVLPLTPALHQGSGSLNQAQLWLDIKLPNMENPFFYTPLQTRLAVPNMDPSKRSSAMVTT